MRDRPIPITKPFVKRLWRKAECDGNVTGETVTDVASDCPGVGTVRCGWRERNANFRTDGSTRSRADKSSASYRREPSRTDR